VSALLSLLLALTVAISTPCEYEDSTNCLWNADLRGNGVGNSFVTLTI